MIIVLTIIHVLSCLLLILLVLLQSGKGAEISASFGGSSQTVFGTSGGANFFTRLTAGTAAVFMITSIALTLAMSKSQKSVFEGAPAATTAPVTAPTGAVPPAQSAAPATDGTTAPTGPKK